jgi:hypothetical protein
MMFNKDTKRMEAFVGIDVAFAKRKVLPIVVCVRNEAVLQPLPLYGQEGIMPPRGQGNVKSLDLKTVADFADFTARYLHAVEDRFRVTIRRIAIDSPSTPKVTGTPRREAEKALDTRGISCITTPDEQQFETIRAKAMAHLAGGGQESRLPHANQLWMLVGFDLFRRLRQEWECLEVFPQAIAVSLGSATIHKSQHDGFLDQLLSVACFTGWPRTPSEVALKEIGYGKLHDRLDSYLAAWVASLESDHREALGNPPDDAIWIPRIKSISNQ